MIEKYWQTFCKQMKLPLETPYEAFAFAFGNTKQMHDDLAALVVAGIKTGTCSGYELYVLENEPLPEKDQYSIVLDGRKEPVCVTYTTEIQLLSFKEITAHHALLEGEGDLSLDYWQKEHLRFFTPSYTKRGLQFDENSLLVFEIFEVVTMRDEQHT